MYHKRGLFISLIAAGLLLGVQTAAAREVHRPGVPPERTLKQQNGWIGQALAVPATCTRVLHVTCISPFIQPSGMCCLDRLTPIGWIGCDAMCRF